MHGGDLEIDYSKYDDYLGNTEEYKMLEEKFNNVTETLVEDTYKKELEKQIKNDIEELGFNVENISLEINIETGEITNIGLNISTDKKEKNISINKIEIGKSYKKSTLPNQEIEKIRNFLSEKYSLDNEVITINSA